LPSAEITTDEVQSDDGLIEAGFKRHYRINKDYDQDLYLILLRSRGMKLFRRCAAVDPFPNIPAGGIPRVSPKARPET